MKKYLKKIEVLSAIFFIFVFIFTKMYSNYLEYTDAFYCAVSFQTFTGNSMVEKQEELKLIATTQMITSYLLIVIILYNILDIKP